MPKINIEERTVSLINGAGKLNIYIQRNEIRSSSDTHHKNQHKMDQRIKCKT
jgi:hypothetical protein